VCAITRGLFAIAKLLCLFLYRTFRAIDDNGSRTLDREELKYGLCDYGMNLSPAEVNQLFNELDKDNSGHISFDEFLQALRVYLKFIFFFTGIAFTQWCKKWVFRPERATNYSDKHEIWHGRADHSSRANIHVYWGRNVGIQPPKLSKF